ncbi:bifunctional nicotinamidase/pyrazinamidase [Nitritalea halalkaliphila]|nr:bifunctional nicotinamidase/pyrazinamidase [Nitritalea halalkaliphila]
MDSKGKHALVIIDAQLDFMPGGALAVQEGDQIVPFINALQADFQTIIATQDWHPENHGSFAANHDGKSPGEWIELEGLQQVLWPVHCVQGSPGADFHPELDRSRWMRIFQKGQNPGVDSYSGFFDNNQVVDTGLHAYLQSLGVTELTCVGLAADYCVKFTVLDALRLGYQVHVPAAGTRAVNLQEGDFERALAEMQQAGATIQ